MHFRKGDKTIILRGINLADAKFPQGCPSYRIESLDGSSDCSYNDTPFNLQDAPRHLQKLRYLGFNVLRIPIVWEALEHAGPGVYDDAYMEHVRNLTQICIDHGFHILINPHQDLWSRHVGGTGAPLWTMHACGLDPAHFTETHAAMRYCEWPPDASAEEKDPKATPPMMWTTNHDRLAPATVFALFFAGRHFAPKCRIDGVNIQDYLQRHYFAAYAKLAEKLGHLPFGYDSMNEPHSGYIGWKDLHKSERDGAKIGSTPTPIQSMRLGMGMAQEVDEYRLGKAGPHKVGTMRIEPRHSCWLKEEDPRWKWNRAASWPLNTCIWALHGIWDLETGELKKPDYFDRLPHKSDSATKSENNSDEALSFTSAFWQEFHQNWTSMLRGHSNKTVVFLQPSVFAPPPPQGQSPQPLTAYSPHFYDALTVMRRHWHTRWNVDILGLLRSHYRTKILGLRIGKENVRKLVSDEIGLLARDLDNKIPTLIGETGIPFNLDNSKAYEDGDYTAHVQAMDALLSACDDHILGYTVWTYSALNTHEWGDDWNGEDLSIHCTETGSFPQHPLLGGFRAAAAYCRPYVQSLTGDPVAMSFDYKTSKFALEIRSDDLGSAIVYVPWLHYRRADDTEELSVEVKVTDGEWTLEGQQLTWSYNIGGRLELERAGGVLSPEQLGTVVK